MRRPLVLVLVPLLLVLTGCKVETTIDVDVNREGGGEVAVEVDLDEEATRSAPNLAEKVSVEDLRATGWDVEGPVVKDGKTEMRVSHVFDTPEQAVALIDQLDPANGPLRDFRLTQQRSLTSVETEFAGIVELSNGIESWGDPILRERAGTALGFDPKDLRENLGINPEEAFPVTLSVSVPGRAQQFAPQANDGEWKLAYGRVNELRATSKGLNVRPLTSFGISIFLLVLAITIFAIWKPYRPQHKR